MRLFGSWEAIASKHHNVTIGLAQYWTTGQPYSAAGTVVVTNYVTNPGYKTPSAAANQTYWFTRRGAFRLNSVTSTDLSVTYAFSPKLFGSDLQIYVKPEVRNVFNEQTVTNVDQTVDTNYNNSSLKAFNPFTDTPVECPMSYTKAQCAAGNYNWQKRTVANTTGASTNFGKPSTPTDYQAPRTYLLAIGIRF
jgi:hypothetical protein